MKFIHGRMWQPPLNTLKDPKQPLSGGQMF